MDWRFGGGSVSAFEVDGLVAEWRESGDIGGIDWVAVVGQMVEGVLGVDGLPEHDDVDHEAERSELVFLSGLVFLAELSEHAVEDVSGESVAVFAPVENTADISPVDRIVAVGENVQCLDHSAEFTDCPGQH